MADWFEHLLGRLPVPEAYRAELRSLLGGEDRHYHGKAHIARLWQRHLQFGAGLRVADEPWATRIACAIAFHDAVFDAGRIDNETASAALWREAGASLDKRDVEWVARTIEMTADHLDAQPDPGMAPLAWTARLWVLDLDLTPLGEVPAEFDANTARLRREYARLSDDAWEMQQLRFFSRLAAAPRLFRSAVLMDAFGDMAQTNLHRELAALRRSAALPVSAASPT